MITYKRSVIRRILAIVIAKIGIQQYDRQTIYERIKPPSNKRGISTFGTEDYSVAGLE